jgi:4-amino-4-deoxy-L-arabinose transferase-like glycosyltransferase
MTTALTRAPERVASPAPARGWRPWLSRRWASLAILTASLSIVGAANAWNLQGWPGRVNDDEGTYVAEAWAMIYPHHLSHYTYWYDHPPLGWALIAAYTWVTDGFHRDPSAVMVGRELMWLVTLVSSALLYLLARRLRFRRVTAAVGVLLFGLSPLAIYYHRMVSLDNLATMWTLAAVAIAGSPRRSLGAAFWSGVCFAAAVLSKETIAVLLPAVVWMLWQHTDKRTRRWNMASFTVAFSLLVLAYPLFAALRGELFPGRGQVSLTWALEWQLFRRASSGSLLVTHSGTFGLAHFWFSIDPWLLLAGAALVPAGLVIRRLRPLAFALLLQIAIMIKGGYLPYFYVTAMLPFAALLISGVADSLCNPIVRIYRSRLCKSGTRVAAWLPRAGCVPAVAAALVFIMVVAPNWWNALRQQAKVDGDGSELAATAWILDNVPRHDVVVVDDYMWPDLRLHAMSPLWLWKVNTDPWVTKHVLPHGYASIDYVVLAPQASSTLATLPTLKAALQHSRIVKKFGDGITARVVIKPRVGLRRGECLALPPSGKPRATLPGVGPGPFHYCQRRSRPPALISRPGRRMVRQPPRPVRAAAAVTTAYTLGAPVSRPARYALNINPAPRRPGVGCRTREPLITASQPGSPEWFLPSRITMPEAKRGSQA